MLYTISIFWEKDSSDLVELPDVRVLPCGSDGMQVIGTYDAIQELADYVSEHPDLYSTPEGMKQADSSAIHGAIEFGKGVDDRIGVYEELGHKTSVYHYILAETQHGKRYWRVVGDLDEVARSEQKHVYSFAAHDREHAFDVVEANGDPEAWVADGDVVWL